MCHPFGRIAMHAPILRYFTTVAELGTIREASRRLHVSASAINRQILNLEDLIGEPVFERRRTGLHLTEAGEIVFRHCRNTLHDFARMTGEIDARRSRVTGTVQILTLDSMTVQFLPQSIASFHAEHPLVEIHVRSADPATTIRDVSRGEADVGFGSPRGRGRCRPARSLPLASSMMVSKCVASAAGGPRLSPRRESDTSGST